MSRSCCACSERRRAHTSCISRTIPCTKRPTTRCARGSFRFGSRGRNWCSASRKVKSSGRARRSSRKPPGGAIAFPGCSSRMACASCACSVGSSSRNSTSCSVFFSACARRRPMRTTCSRCSGKATFLRCATATSICRRRRRCRSPTVAKRWPRRTRIRACRWRRTSRLRRVTAWSACRTSMGRSTSSMKRRSSISRRKCGGSISPICARMW